MDFSTNRQLKRLVRVVEQSVAALALEDAAFDFLRGGRLVHVAAGTHAAVPRYDGIGAVTAMNLQVTLVQRRAHRLKDAVRVGTPRGIAGALRGAGMDLVVL